MYTVTVRDHLMIAHSFRGQIFGPAQRLHGATYIVDASFSGPELSADDILIDIGLAATQLRELVGELNYRNLDDDPAFGTGNSSTERVARLLADRLADRVRDGRFGPAASGLNALSVTLHESHVAWARYERNL